MLRPSPFIRPMHPKTAIRADYLTMNRVLQAGWIAQLKIHGHRAQIHISADVHTEPIAYNRHGSLHKVRLPMEMVRELRRVFLPSHGWNVIDGEWLKPQKKLFVFDFIKKEGKLLNRLTFHQRWNLLPRNYISPYISTLSLISDVRKCAAILENPPPFCEGLVFKSKNTRGFEDTSIVRCRFKN